MEARTPARPAFYALAPGGWRDYVTLLHLPYTLWHLSYVVIGGCLAANPDGGLTIQGVTDDSDAGDKGLQRGDVIVRAGDQKPDTTAQFAAEVAQAKHDGRKSVLLLVKHGDRQLFIPVVIASENG